MVSVPGAGAICRPGYSPGGLPGLGAVGVADGARHHHGAGGQQPRQAGQPSAPPRPASRCSPGLQGCPSSAGTTRVGVWDSIGSRPACCTF